MSVIYDFTVRTIDGRQQSLADYRDKTLLIVNVASQCGFTPQYAGLEALYRKLAPRGLVVLAFPCDQFGHQEPGAEAAIKEFCTVNYSVSFPLYAKVAVNGAAAHPLFRMLKRAARGVLGTQAIKWNFTKFLVGRDGVVIRRYAPTDTPQRIETEIAARL